MCSLAIKEFAEQKVYSWYKNVRSMLSNKAVNIHVWPAFQKIEQTETYILCRGHLEVFSKMKLIELES